MADDRHGPQENVCSRPGGNQQRLFAEARDDQFLDPRVAQPLMDPRGNLGPQPDCDGRVRLSNRQVDAARAF